VGNAAIVNERATAVVSVIPILPIIWLLLTARAIAGHSWRTLWAAAMLSLLFSLLTGFSIGPLSFLLTCLQLASAIALRFGAVWRDWLGLLLGGVVVWVLIVPVQVAVGSWMPWTLAWPATAAVASAVLAVGLPRREAAAVLTAPALLIAVVCGALVV
jgi:hypothetical protein